MITPQNDFTSNSHFMVSLETSAWCMMALVWLDVQLATPWLLWGMSFLLKTVE